MFREEYGPSEVACTWQNRYKGMIVMPTIGFSKLLLIGAGPTVIGRSNGLDQATAQTCRILKAEGYQVIVVDSNPATLTTDRDLADGTYLEPLTASFLTKIIAKERPDALVVSCGGPMALNLGLKLACSGVLAQYGTRLLGITEAALKIMADDEEWAGTVRGAGLKFPEGVTVTDTAKSAAYLFEHEFPLFVRAASHLDPAPRFLAYNREEFTELIEKELALTDNGQVRLEKSLMGWKQLEFEFLIDCSGESRLIGTVEQLDPVGVHSGDSAAVLPIQSVSYEAYREILDRCRLLLKTLGLVGCANLKFAVNQAADRWVLLKLTPGYNRTAQWVAGSTGLAVARIAAQLTVGHTLNEVLPVRDRGPIDQGHLLVRLPRFDFRKFYDTEQTLDTVMKSVGEVVAAAPEFKAALQKAVRSLAIGRSGLGSDGRDPDPAVLPLSSIRAKLINPNPDRLFFIRYALKQGLTQDEIRNLTGIDPWFLKQLAELNGFEKELTTYALYNLTPQVFLRAKQWGFSDLQIAFLLRSTEDQVRNARKKLGIMPDFVSVGDPENYYYHSTYDSVHTGPPPQGERPDRTQPERKRVMLVGGGPNRIDHGTEHDYALYHGALAIQNSGYQGIIVNSNPAALTTLDGGHCLLFMEPVTGEDIRNIVERERPDIALLQFGGKPAMELGPTLRQAGVEVLDGFEDLRISARLAELGLRDAAGESQAENLMQDAVGVEIHCITDGIGVKVIGVLEQIEEAWIDSGDSAQALPSYTLGQETLDKLYHYTAHLLPGTGFKGLATVKYAIRHDQIILREVLPGISQTLPFICKTTGNDWIETAIKVLCGSGLPDPGSVNALNLRYSAVKEAVFSFDHFPDIDTLLGPKKRSTGMVSGIGRDFGLAFIKAELAAGDKIPTAGSIYLNLRDEDKRAFIPLIKQFMTFGFKIFSTPEIAAVFSRNNLPCQAVAKVGEGRPNILDKIKSGEIQWLIDTGHRDHRDERIVRSTAVARGIPIITTIAAAEAVVLGLERYLKDDFELETLQQYYSGENI